MLFSSFKNLKMGRRQDIVLYGSGGMGREIAVLIGAINGVSPRFRLLGYIDDACREPVNGLPVLGDKSWLLAHKDQVVCACTVGNPRQRAAIMREMEAQGVTFETLIHPNVYIDPTVKIGAGTIIADNCGISVNVEIGRGAFLNNGVNVGHDTSIGDFSVCHSRAQISGGCRIGQSASIGSMSFLLQEKAVGDQAVVAPGSIVLRSVKPDTYVMGNPARVIEI